MADEKTDNREKILDAFWKGALVMKPEEPAVPVEEKTAEGEKRELTEEERSARLRGAAEHLFGGGAFVEREF